MTTTQDTNTRLKNRRGELLKQVKRLQGTLRLNEVLISVTQKRNLKQELIQTWAKQIGEEIGTGPKPSDGGNVFAFDSQQLENFVNVVSSYERHRVAQEVESLGSGQLGRSRTQSEIVEFIRNMKNKA